MNSFLKSIRVGIEIFGLPLLVTIVMLIYASRPVGGSQKPSSGKTERTGTGQLFLAEQKSAADQKPLGNKH